jgi:DNA-binding response OmpR family regulator
MSSEINPCAPLDVLIAEDDGDIRLAMRQLLENEGYRCAEAVDGRMAVDVARRFLPRIVLLDLMMPEMDGFTAAQQLRADPQTRDVHIHCVTALNFPAAREAAQEAGCDGYLTKPFAMDELLGVVKVALNVCAANGHAAQNAIERLETGLAARAPGRERDWLKEVDNALTDLTAVLQRQAAQMGAAEGLFCDADLNSPTLTRRAAGLSRQAANLREQTRALLVQVRQAAQAFQNQAPPAGPGTALRQPRPAGTVVDFNALRQTGLQLLTDLRQQGEAERDLLFESLSTDIGVGD